MANKFITPLEFYKQIKEITHKVSVRHRLSKDQRDQLLIGVCASMGGLPYGGEKHSDINA